MSATQRRYSDDEILNTFEKSPEPVLTAAEIAEEVGMTRQGANYRLQKLLSEGIVNRKRAGSNAVVWWLASPGSERATA